MKTKLFYLKGLICGLIFIFASLYNVANAQTDTTKTTQPVSTPQVQVDTTKIAQSDSTMQSTDKKSKKVDRKRKDEFILFTGVNFNQLNVESTDFEVTSDVGYQFGGYYKRGKFFYWQAGARYSNAAYSLQDLKNPSDSTAYDFSVKSIDIPLTAGINILSATNRILALRIFVSADPTINFGVGDNDLGIEKDDINSFILYGQGGIGVNVAFLVIEAGYNYGLQDLFKDKKSVPGQVFINLGFRF